MAKRSADQSLPTQDLKKPKSNLSSSGSGSGGLSVFQDLLVSVNERKMEGNKKQFDDTKIFFQNLASNLRDKREQSEEEFNVEVEARFGKKNGKYFKPELQKSEFFQLKNFLDSQKQMDTYDEITCDFIYKDQIRVSVPIGSEDDIPDIQTAEDFTCLKKGKLNTMDLLFSKESYDVRLSLSTETPYDLPYGFNKKSYELIRKKQRSVYIQDDETWRIELTIVTSIQSSRHEVVGRPDNTQGDITYEVEIELDGSLFEEGFKGVPNAVIEKFFQKFLDLLAELNKKIEGEQKPKGGKEISPFPEVKEVLVDSSELESKLKDRVSSCFGKDCI